MYPDDILVPQSREDGGKVISEVSKAITSHKVVLAHYARGREVLQDGRVLSSSITVSKGGQTYTEVFETPVPNGNYFYHYEDPSPRVNSSVLLFNNADAGSVDVTYETRGDYILAATHNRIEEDLAAVETLLGAGVLAMQSGVVAGNNSNLDIPVTAASPGDISDIIFIVNNATGPQRNFTVDTVGHTKVTVVSTLLVDELHYLMILKA